MNNTLTAKEWLEKEGKLDGICENNPDYKGLSYPASEAMERYANYKNSILEEEIRKQCFNYEMWLNAHIKMEQFAGTTERENLFELCKKVFIDKFKNFNIQNNIKE